MDLQTQRDIKDSRDVIRNEIVKALRRAQDEGLHIPVEVQELLRLDEACVGSTIRYAKGKKAAMNVVRTVEAA